jgi:glutamate-ammonia-ligase adenylyltransferase
MLVTCSPLFAATLLQNPEYISWLGRERSDTRVRDKQTLMESLARFALTHSQVEPKILLAGFRRRELLRIFLRDVRRLATIAEITEEISNLADAILEHGLRLAKQEMENQFGQPQAVDDKGRSVPAEICVVSLGKLGSKELNYASDIDLLLIFSENGNTSGSGSKGVITNGEYFSKLAERVLRTVGGRGGEDAAYRVDLRLRPHGRIGPLALTLADTIAYYKNEAADWERQVLIRSRASAGNESLYHKFFYSVESSVFSVDRSVDEALENVRLSKQKIDVHSKAAAGIDIKLGSGGIREIEFIAQALQIAHGGRDRWLRVPHTLISLDRLTDRGLISGLEHTRLSDAYDFLRRLEHILQIENGLQTHLLPNEVGKRTLMAKRLGLEPERLGAVLKRHLINVHSVFERVFRLVPVEAGPQPSGSNREPDSNLPTSTVLEVVSKAAPRYLPVLKARQELLEGLDKIGQPFPKRDYFEILGAAVAKAEVHAEALNRLRRAWYRQLLEIVVSDATGTLELSECKRLQTELAEASIKLALRMAADEAAKKFGSSPECSIAVLALGKLAGKGMDYDSDLDLIFVHSASASGDAPAMGPSPREFYARVVEIFTVVLSSVTRDGNLYRVDLRLRPHGNDGPLVISERRIKEYFEKEADIWELLAFVKLRAVSGDMQFANTLEESLRSIIHERASTIEPEVLAAETRTVRDKLEKQRSDRRSKYIDIKYGAGGLLDVYFALRFLQLRFGIPDETEHRSTAKLLERLLEHPSLSRLRVPLAELARAYRFLSHVDHEIRLAVGRTAKVTSSMTYPARALGNELYKSNLHLSEELVPSLIAARQAFDQLLSDSGH